jgi:hypothetical protein
MEERRTSDPTVAGSSPAMPGHFFLYTLLCDRLAEWSKAADSSSVLFGGAGSNPAPVTFSFFLQFLLHMAL